MAPSSAMTKRPLGLRSAKTGTFLPMRVKSSMDKDTPTACAMANKCSTAFVDPPSAVTTVIAFSKALSVMISLGRISFLIKFITALPAFTQSRVLALEIAACAELLGRLIPNASMALAIVLAVYIPPQEPAPGIAQDSTACKSLAEIFLLAYAPTDSKTETISRFLPLRHPGKMVPP